MASDTAKTPADSLADIAAKASPEQVSALLGELWRTHAIKFAERGVPAELIARSLLDIGTKVAMDVWGPPATAAALIATADVIKDHPNLNSPAGKH